MNLNMFLFLICAEFEVKKKKTSVSSFHKEKNFKPCLTKQLLSMFKLWCERGIASKLNVTVEPVFASPKLDQQLKRHYFKSPIVNQQCLVYEFNVTCVM